MTKTKKKVKRLFSFFRFFGNKKAEGKISRAGLIPRHEYSSADILQLAKVIAGEQSGLYQLILEASDNLLSFRKRYIKTGKAGEFELHDILDMIVPSQPEAFSLMDMFLELASQKNLAGFPYNYQDVFEVVSSMLSDRDIKSYDKRFLKILQTPEFRILLKTENFLQLNSELLKKYNLMLVSIEDSEVNSFAIIERERYPDLAELDFVSNRFKVTGEYLQTVALLGRLLSQRKRQTTEVVE